MKKLNNNKNKLQIKSNKAQAAMEQPFGLGTSCLTKAWGKCSQGRHKAYRTIGRRSQAAMEFLMTYGWALLVVLIAIAALAFFGLLNPSRFLPEKADLGPGLIVQDALVKENAVVLLVHNGLGQTLRDFSIELDDCTNGGLPTIPITFTAGSTQMFTVFCNHEFSSNSRLRKAMTASYSTRTAGHSLNHKRAGEITWNIQEGMLYKRLHTGQQTCYVGVTSAEQPCTNEAAAGQDGNIDGTAKYFQELSDNVIRDLHTGLYWTANQSGRTQSQAETYCNQLNQGGFTDWRLPNFVELVTVMNHGTEGNSSPSSDWDNTHDTNSRIWTSTQNPVNSANYFYVTPRGGFISTGSEAGSSTRRSVCVRGSTVGLNLVDGQNVPKQFNDNGDGTVIDLDTGLMWQQGDSGNEINWQDALQNCTNLNLAGHNDWRLPTVSEIVTLIDYERSDYKNPVFTAHDYYWTGTSSVAGSAYLVVLDDGDIGYGVKDLDVIFRARCVRDQ